MKYIVSGLSGQLAKYMDGDIVFAFNKIGVDNKGDTSKHGGRVINTKDYFTVKKAGHPVMNLNDVEHNLIKKVAEYVPKNDIWV
jgi:hypothetical protein